MRLTVKAWNRVRPRTEVVFHNKQVNANTSGLQGQLLTQAGMNNKLPDIDFEKFRLMRQAIPWLAAGIDIRAEGVIYAERSVVSKDSEYTLTEPEKELAQYIESFFDSPDPGGVSTNRQRLFGPWISDALVVGRGAIRKYLDKQGYITRLRTLDARRLIDHPDYDFDKPDAGIPDSPGGAATPRWLYLDEDPQTGAISKDKGEDLRNDEVCILEPTPTSYTRSGLSPLLYLDSYLDAHQEVFASIRKAQNEGQPPGVFKIPSAQPATIQKLQNEWRKRARGRLSAIFAALPADAEWVAMGDLNLAARGSFAFLDILIRGVAAALRISTVALGWTQTTLERNAAEQGESQDEGQFNLLRLAQGAINSDLMPFFQGSENLIWAFTSLPSDDEAENADTIEKWSGGHFVIPSPDDLRKRAGMDAIKRKDGSMLDRAYKDMWVVGSTGPVPMFLYLGLAAMQAVPGYDPDTGEVDDAAAAKEQALKAPPQLQGAAMGAGAVGQDSKAPPTNGTRNGNAPTNGNAAPDEKDKVAILTGQQKAAKSDDKEDEKPMPPLSTRLDPDQEKIAAKLEEELLQEYPWHGDRKPTETTG